jgi:hemerythrin-like metal-binding protein
MIQIPLTGVAELDRQHLYLRDIVDQIALACDQGLSSDRTRLLNHLLHSFEEHAKWEEARMAEISWPKAEIHQMEHQGLIRDLRRWALLCESGGIPQWQLKEHLPGWILQHIDSADLDFAKHLLQRMDQGQIAELPVIDFPWEGAAPKPSTLES